MSDFIEDLIEAIEDWAYDNPCAMFGLGLVLGIMIF